MAKNKHNMEDMDMERVDLNTASAEEIARSIPQINTKKAQEIVDYRQNNGPFRNWEDFKRIPGFSTDMVNNLKQGGTLG